MSTKLFFSYYRQLESTKTTSLTSTTWVSTRCSTHFCVYFLHGRLQWTQTPTIYSLTHTQTHPWLTRHHLLTQCLHPGVVVDLADSDDQDSPFQPVESPVTIVTRGSVPVFRMLCQSVALTQLSIHMFVCILWVRPFLWDILTPTSNTEDVKYITLI